MTPRREELLAAVATASWAGAAAVAGPAWPWLGVGFVAVTLGVTLLVLDPVGTRALLRPTAGRVLAGAAAGLAMCGATYLVYPPAVRALPWLARETAELYRAFRTLPPAHAALALLPIVLGEELVWRGLVQGALARRIGATAAVLVAAAGFGVAHAAIGSPALPAVAFACAVAWGGLRAWTGSLVPAIVAHLVWNGLVMLLRPLQ